MNRSMCLYLPSLPIDRLGMGPGGSPDRLAVAVTEQVAGTVRVVRCNGAASAGGVCHGMTLAEAKALLPGLHLACGDAEGDRRALEALAVWAQAFSPVVQPEPPDTLLVDVHGCARLFRGEANLLGQALEGLRARGFGARGAIADTPGSAWAIAHAHADPAVVTHPGRDVEELLSLPVGALRIDRQAVAALAAVGVETVEALLYLPRASLASRLGDAVLHRLDQALGNVAEPLTAFSPPPPVRSFVRLGAGTDRREVIHVAAERALGRFCAELARRSVGVMRMDVTFFCPEASPVTATVTVSQATRSAKRLGALLTVRLEALRLPKKTDGLLIRAGQVEPLDDRQGDLFDTSASDEGELADLIDRLSLRLGPVSVARVTLVSDHQPERAYAYVHGGEGTEGRRDEGTGKKRGTEGQRIAEAGVRPLRVWQQPVAVAVVALWPEGPPATFRFRSVEHTVAACTGPERLETGWWRGGDVRRDYFRVVSRSGEGFWMFRDRVSGQWFVHGVFE